MFKKMISAVKGKATAVVTTALGVFAASSASAAGMDAAAVSAITDAIDFGPIITGIAAICTAVAAVLVAWKGGKLLLTALRSS